jgi:hypothetical protein
VAKLLFVAKRARPDILLAVSFMTTRVKKPDIDDWHKLIRVLSYLHGSMDITLTLVCDKIAKLSWYIDGSYASHIHSENIMYWGTVYVKTGPIAHAHLLYVERA